MKPSKTSTGQKISREDFVRDPGAAVRAASSSGRVIIVDANGRTKAVITVPQSALPIPKL